MVTDAQRGGHGQVTGRGGGSAAATWSGGARGCRSEARGLAAVAAGGDVGGAFVDDAAVLEDGVGADAGDEVPAGVVDLDNDELVAALQRRGGLLGGWGVAARSGTMTIRAPPPARSEISSPQTHSWVASPHQGGGPGPSSTQTPRAVTPFRPRRTGPEAGSGDRWRSGSEGLCVLLREVKEHSAGAVIQVCRRQRSRLGITSQPRGSKGSQCTSEGSPRRCSEWPRWNVIVWPSRAVRRKSSVRRTNLWRAKCGLVPRNPELSSRSSPA